MSTDHPRSRGVYPTGLLRHSDEWGSSPLARGLRHAARGHHRSSGIIPARAGFTRSDRRQAPNCPDHPRSRGVYSAPWPTAASPLGSSPLARGLLPFQTIIAPAERIIPARAGFTLRHDGFDMRRADHPRSRGVYFHPLSVRVQCGGSSPLARGLPPALRPVPADRRIIPARAGFTMAASTRSRSGGDHPRSRGVYLVGVPAEWVIGGSSPLARGLRQIFHELDEAAGIIPARAGFTTLKHVRAIASPDHPRSRGVYFTRPWIRFCIPGSSPLARGLPGQR